MVISKVTFVMFILRLLLKVSFINKAAHPFLLKHSHLHFFFLWMINVTLHYSLLWKRSALFPEQTILYGLHQFLHALE